MIHLQRVVRMLSKILVFSLDSHDFWHGYLGVMIFLDISEETGVGSVCISARV